MPIDWSVIGGEHHGEYCPLHDREQIQLPRRMPLPLPQKDMDVTTVAPTIPVDTYRLTRFHNGKDEFRIWVPNDVRRGSEMEHVLWMALRPLKDDV